MGAKSLKRISGGPRDVLGSSMRLQGVSEGYPLNPSSISGSFWASGDFIWSQERFRKFQVDSGAFQAFRGVSADHMLTDL